jgi:photosystem II stability/assembly factor-like uncharacterized protein
MRDSYLELYRSTVAGYICGILMAVVGLGAVRATEITFTDINPDRSTLDPTDPDGATGGRVNGLAIVADNNRVFYAESEWGGIYKSKDGGATWTRLDSHLPTVTWDVEVDPKETERVYATSFYDGRVNSLAGINVSTDGGASWNHPTVVIPPDLMCSQERKEEPSAFGISIDPDEPQKAYVGTSCGLAISNDHGITWRAVDPTPDDAANNVWDVVVHHNGIIDICGDDGHLRSTDGGSSWKSGSGLLSGICSIAASPYEEDVIFVTVGRDIYESDDGGIKWENLGTPDFRRQGRVPFVATNPRGKGTFDLWFGDVSLYRGSCTSSPSTGGLRCPMARTGSPSSPPPTGWAGPFTRGVGGHDDVGDIAFDSKTRIGACPVLFSSDGGIYFNTNRDNPSCHSPTWEQPKVTPHGLWVFGLAGAHRLGVVGEDLYFGNQDNGTFAATDAGAAKPTWYNRDCCDGFDFVADPVRVVYTLCCGFSILRGNPGIPPPVSVVTNPPGSIPTFNFPDFIDQYGDNRYVAVTYSGAYITQDITASPVSWVQLGAGSTPTGGFCAVKAAVKSGVPTFYALTRCNLGELWKYTGTATGSVWQRVDNRSGLSGGFSIYAVDRSNPDRLYAANISSSGPRMVYSNDGGASWSFDTNLDEMMNGGGAFRYQTRRGPTNFTSFGTYYQPSLVAFDPMDPNLLVAGGQESGVFLSINGGLTWNLVSDPLTSGDSGIPHIPRARFAYFDHDPADRVDIYVGTQGRGVWRIAYYPVKPTINYSAKIICGVQKEPECLTLARGLYATAINVHNPTNEPVRFLKTLSLTHPPGGQEPGKVIRISEDRLLPGEALEVDCEDIRNRVFPDGFPAPFIKGFLTIGSEDRLNVTAVYSTGNLANDLEHTSIDVEQTPGYKVSQTERPADLIPVPTGDTQRVGAYCEIRDGMLVVTVKNQGVWSAGVSVTEVDFFDFGKSNANTDSLFPGDTTEVLFDIPDGCLPSGVDATCKFKITVDAHAQVSESDETNNTAQSECVIIA